MGLWQHEKEMSNHPRNAWTSDCISRQASGAALHAKAHSYADVDSQSFRVALSSNGTLKARSSFVTVLMSMCLIAQGLETTALRSTVSTRGSLRAMSLMHE